MPNKNCFKKSLAGFGKGPRRLPSLFFLLFGGLIFGGQAGLAGNLPADVLATLNSYNVVWTTPSTNGSPGSMPLGNGDITANVWV